MRGGHARRLEGGVPSQRDADWRETANECPPAPTRRSGSPGRRTIAVVFGGTVTSSVTFPPSRRQAVAIMPLGPFTDAFAHASASMNCGAITTSRNAVAVTSGIAAQLPAVSGS